jgi:large subunit ribosomal protein L29
MTKLAEELRECDDDELEVRLENAQKELFNLRFQVATGRLDNVSRIEQVRRSVARILTVQREREFLAAEGLSDVRPHMQARRSSASSASAADDTAGSADSATRARRRRKSADAEAATAGAPDESAVELEEEEVVGEGAGHLEDAADADAAEASDATDAGDDEGDETEEEK